MFNTTGCPPQSSSFVLFTKQLIRISQSEAFFYQVTDTRFSAKSGLSKSLIVPFPVRFSSKSYLVWSCNWYFGHLTGYSASRQNTNHGWTKLTWHAAKAHQKIQLLGPIDKLYYNTPQVSMGYRLINHVGCWWNTRRICKSRAAGKWFTNSSSVLPTSQVVYQPKTRRNLWFIAFI